ncbi:HEPN domain-containing protein [Flavobacterium sp. RSP29]|uniref:HEPN domain-containing protein n=1 Tax=Flavobacterium sp. RSP29 TaxID=3401731 RepID=UPI003AAB85B4
MLNIKKSPAQIFSKRLVSIKYSQLIIQDLEKIIIGIHKRNLIESYLLNSYIINLVTSLQTFVQDLLGESVNKIINSIENEQLVQIIISNFQDKIKRFDTPNTENIDQIFESVLGIQKITQMLKNVDVTKERIIKIIKIRHSIAHTGYAKV